MSNFSNTQHYKIVNAIHFSFFERKRLSIDRQNGSNSLQNIANKKSSSFELGMHLSLFQAFKNTVQNFATLKIHYFQIRK